MILLTLTYILFYDSLLLKVNFKLSVNDELNFNIKTVGGTRLLKNEKRLREDGKKDYSLLFIIKNKLFEEQLICW